MTAVAELDPYRLPLPSPDTPVVPRDRLVARHAHLNARYDAATWQLAPLTGNPSDRLRVIYWRNCPAILREEIRLAAWILINGELRPTFLKGRRTLRGQIAAEATWQTIMAWIRFATWLETRGIQSLSQCNVGILHDYGLHLRDSAGRSHVTKMLGCLTRLWAFDELSGRPTGIARPPWDECGVDDYLPTGKGNGGENSREPLAAATMGPLLIWAMRLVDDFADDILAAWAEHQRLSRAARSNVATAAGQAALGTYLNPLIAGAPVPAIWHRGEQRLARSYIGGITGASLKQVDTANTCYQLSAAAAQRPGPCPLAAPVTGMINGAPWRRAIGFAEAPVLMRHLGTAAFIVCAYLTGMRPEEVLGMRSGCCPDPEPGEDGQAGWHLIRSFHYKTVTDDSGNHRPDGAEREVPWVAITPVVNAIRVLERMVGREHLLFDHAAHDAVYGGRPGSGSLKSGTMRQRIEDFAAWANGEADTQELPGEMVRADPGGAIGTARFRRTLAWHIARRPGGLVALAIQYGHMQTALTTEVSGGYATRSRSGIHDMIALETALATAETAADLHEHFEAGGGVSGPAARRALIEAASGPRFEGRDVKTDFAAKYQAARRYLARDGAVLYDNPHALLLCLYKHDRALCARYSAKNTPALDQCIPGCGNAVRTDEHAALLRAKAEQFDKQAAHAPQPIGDRLRANADKLRKWADDHDRTRITRQETNP